MGEGPDEAEAIFHAIQKCDTGGSKQARLIIPETFHDHPRIVRPKVRWSLSVCGRHVRGPGAAAVGHVDVCGPAFQTLPEQPRAGDLRQGGARRQRALHPRRGVVRLAVDPGLQLSQPGADPDRDSTARRCRWKTSASTCPACSPWPSAPRRTRCRTPPSACWVRTPPRCASRPRKSSSANCGK